MIPASGAKRQNNKVWTTIGVTEINMQCNVYDSMGNMKPKKYNKLHKTFVTWTFVEGSYWLYDLIIRYEYHV